MENYPIAFEEIILEDNITIYAVNIEDMDDAFQMFIDENLVSICKGKRNIKIETVKTQFRKYLETKNKSNLLTGSVSEFFIHLFLRTQNFKQEFLYFNLEENSIKKGFDGYYSKNNMDWILESKSTTTVTEKHKSIIGIAYNGIKNKIEGKDSKNNPWEEAYNHARHSDVNTGKSLTDKLSALSELYTVEKYGMIEEFNIMTSSTIFLEEHWQNIDVKELKYDIEHYLKDKKFKSIILICLNKKSLNLLLDYLKQ